jgi:hypothetical protein
VADLNGTKLGDPAPIFSVFSRVISLQDDIVDLSRRVRQQSLSIWGEHFSHSTGAKPRFLALIE